ncbi:hypothetical protein DPEC_G00300630 [Dallia pectoralis]|uniref:Uncharacterized protein n=1 Tax=Dallia pectoralis TaxID=75939 RepID=A0ACC2FGK0_DALPE|nr:hypothetical protein DPEC_G00300630 [Dallia pectoralis]
MNPESPAVRERPHAARQNAANENGDYNCLGSWEVTMDLSEPKPPEGRMQYSDPPSQMTQRHRVHGDEWTHRCRGNSPPAAAPYRGRPSAAPEIPCHAAIKS